MPGPRHLRECLGRGTSAGGLVVDNIIKPKLGLQPKPFGEACYAL
jgi:ribulose-bisphosphate carboxylase large chain